MTDVSKSRKFERRREAMIDIASEIINSAGARGLTLAEVGRRANLDTSSVTYYFRRKDDLVAACLDRSLDWIQAAASRAASEPGPEARISAYVSENFALLKRQRSENVSRLAVLSDLSSLTDATQETIRSHLNASFRIISGFWDSTDDLAARARRAVGTSILTSCLFWLPGWIELYRIADMDRAEASFADFLLNGLTLRPFEAPAIQALEVEEKDADPQDRFLRAATRLINAYGYQGAKVSRIAEELGVSTGSFYHHLEGKDDLVVACFERSFSIIERAFQRAEESGSNGGEKLEHLITQLVAHQFGAPTPLLQISAYQALPPDLRHQMFVTTLGLALHVAGIISEGIADGSIRPVDPMIAAQNLLAAVLGSAGLTRWTANRPIPEAVDFYGQSLLGGL